MQPRFLPAAFCRPPSRFPLHCSPFPLILSIATIPTSTFRRLSCLESFSIHNIYCIAPGCSSATSYHLLIITHYSPITIHQLPAENAPHFLRANSRKGVLQSWSKTHQFFEIFANFLKFLRIFANFLQFFAFFSADLRVLSASGGLMRDFILPVLPILPKTVSFIRLWRTVFY
jgi:hypothetical protein